MKTHEILDSIILKNGANYQIGVAIEEMAELTKELTKHLRNKGNEYGICEEIADVEIMLAQLKLIYKKSTILVPFYKRFKLKRLQRLYIEGDAQ
jgi:hypothetical protein